MIRFQQTPPNFTPALTCERSLIARMAEDMREMAHAGQNVSVETLKQCGWTEDTIKRMHGQAIERARRLSVRRVA